MTDPLESAGVTAAEIRAILASLGDVPDDTPAITVGHDDDIGSGQHGWPRTTYTAGDLRRRIAAQTREDCPTMTTDAVKPTAPPKTALTGSDDELIRILDRDEALVCTRVWEAWHYGTMHDSDFEAYTATADDPESGVAEIRAWRDAAVAQFRDSLASHIEAAADQPTSNLGQEWRAHELRALARMVRDFTPRD